METDEQLMLRLREQSNIPLLNAEYATGPFETAQHFLLIGTCFKGGWGDADWSVRTQQGECDFDASGGANQEQKRRVLAAFPKSWIGKLMIEHGFDPKWRYPLVRRGLGSNGT